MTPEEFSAAIKVIGWKQADFCRMAGLHPSTASRWMMKETPIPDWVPKFLGMAMEIKRLYEQYVLPPKGGGKQQE